RTRVDAAFSAVVAYVPHVIDDHGLVVDIRHVCDVVHGPVVEEDAVSPIASLITETAIPESVVDAAIKPDVRPPVAFVENKKAVAPTPPSWCPEELGFRNQYPSARHP